MLSLVAIVALAAAVNAQDATTETAVVASETASASAAAARETPVECEGLCTLNTCEKETDKPACRKNCAAKALACANARTKAAVDRWQASNDQFKQRLDDIRQKNGDLSTITVEDAKAKCNTLCDNNAGDRLAACKAVCANITDARSGLAAAAKLLTAAARSKWDEIVAANPEGAQQVKDAAQRLRDAVATQRAFFTMQRQTIAAALDARIAAFKKARQERIDKIDAAKAAFQAYKDKLAAAKTKEERDQIRADAKAQVQQAIDDAKAAFQAVKAKWGEKKKALIAKVIAAKKERRANRKIIVASFIKLLGTLEDLKTAAEPLEGEVGETEAEGAATKRAGTTVTLVVSCDDADSACAEAVNNVLSGAVADAADVTVTETTEDEVTYEPPATLPEETEETTKKGSAASLVMGAAAATLALVSMLL